MYLAKIIYENSITLLLTFLVFERTHSYHAIAQINFFFFFKKLKSKESLSQEERERKGKRQERWQKD